MLPKYFSIAGGIAGLAYTFLGMGGAYRGMEVGAPRLLGEYLVLCCFTAPLGAAIGLGFGCLAAGLVNVFRKPKSIPPQ